MGITNMNSREATKTAILKSLLDGKKYRGEQIVDAVNQSKKTVYKYRTELVEEGLVEMPPITPRDRRPKYRITDKGKTYFVNQLAKDLMTTCQSFEQTLKQLQTPKNLEKFRKAYLESEKDFDEKYNAIKLPTSSEEFSASSEELFNQLMSYAKETTSGILIGVVREAYRLWVDVTGKGKGEGAIIGFNEDGSFYFDTYSEFIKGGLIREGQPMDWAVVKAVFCVDKNKEGREV